MAGDHDTMPDIVEVRTHPVPDTWVVVCPTCEQRHDLDVSEDSAGLFTPDDQDRFLKCDCGVLLDIGGVQLSPIP